MSDKGCQLSKRLTACHIRLHGATFRTSKQFSNEKNDSSVVKEEHSVFNILKRVIANCTYCSVNRSQLLYNVIVCTLFILFFFGETASAVVQIKYDSTTGFEQNEGWTDMMYKDDDGEIISIASGDFYMRRAQILTDATYVHSGSQGLRIIGKYYTSGPPHEPKGELQIQNLNYPGCFGVWIKHVHGNPHNIEINIDLNDGQGFQFVTNFYVDLNTNSDWVYFETSLPQAVNKSGVTIQLRNTGGNGCYYAFDDMVVVSHTLSLVTNDTSVSFDVKTGDIYSFIDRDTGSEFMSPVYREPLFRITLTLSPGGFSTELNSREFTTVTPSKTGYSTFEIEFKDHTALPAVSVIVTGEAPDDGMIRMRISVKNNSSQCVANVVFPQLPFSAALSGDRSDDYLLMPWSGGGLLRAPGRFTLAKDASYPGLAFAQFYALYDDTALKRHTLFAGNAQPVWSSYCVHINRDFPCSSLRLRRMMKGRVTHCLLQCAGRVSSTVKLKFVCT